MEAQAEVDELPSEHNELERDEQFFQLVELGQLHSVSQALDQGADPNTVNHFGTSVLLRAVLDGRLGIIRMLLANGASVTQTDCFGRNPVKSVPTWAHPSIKLWLKGKVPEDQDELVVGWQDTPSLQTEEYQIYTDLNINALKLRLRNPLFFAEALAEVFEVLQWVGYLDLSEAILDEASILTLADPATPYVRQLNLVIFSVTQAQIFDLTNLPFRRILI